MLPICGVLALLLSLLSPAPSTVSPAAAQNCTTSPCSFSFTGGLQTFTVPAGVTTVTITAVGAYGGELPPNFLGGRGASLQGDFAVVQRHHKVAVWRH